MCLFPIQLKKEKATQMLNDTYRMQQVPCGTCLECRKLRVNSWFVRLLSELKHCDTAHFVTFTYDEHTIPFSENGLMTLDYTDFQKFMKRIRKSYIKKEDKKAVYFLVGEYGSKTYRPHYHAIMFNVPQNAIEKEWTHGFVHFGKVEEKSIYYTLKYALKRSFRDGDIDPDDDRKPEKALMSKGIGLKYLTPEMVKYFKDDVTRPVTILGNKKLPIPRYYRDKIFTEYDKKIRNLSNEKLKIKVWNRQLDPQWKHRIQRAYKKKQLQLQKTD